MEGAEMSAGMQPVLSPRPHASSARWPLLPSGCGEPGSAGAREKQMQLHTPRLCLQPAMLR